MGLALPVAILVAVRAGRMLHQMNSVNMETQITDLAVDVVKEKIVYQLKLLFAVYKDTTDIHFNPPPGINLDEVAQLRDMVISMSSRYWTS